MSTYLYQLLLHIRLQLVQSVFQSCSAVINHAVKLTAAAKTISTENNLFWMSQSQLAVTSGQVEIGMGLLCYRRTELGENAPSCPPGPFIISRTDPQIFQHQIEWWEFPSRIKSEIPWAQIESLASNRMLWGVKIEIWFQIAIQICPSPEKMLMHSLFRYTWDLPEHCNSSLWMPFFDATRSP